MNKVEIVVIMRLASHHPRPAPYRNEHSDPSSEQFDVQTQKIDYVDFSNNCMFGNLIYFIAFPRKL